MAAQQTRLCRDMARARVGPEARGLAVQRRAPGKGSGARHRSQLQLLARPRLVTSACRVCSIKLIYTVFIRFTVYLPLSFHKL